VQDVNELMLLQRLIDMWAELQQSVIDDAVDQHRRRLHACLRATEEHFEYPL